MNIKNKKTIFFLASILLVAIVAMLPLPVLAQKDQQGFQLVPCGGAGDACTFADLTLLIYRIINFLLAGSGIIAVFFIFYNAFRMVSSLGEPEAIANAKHGMTQAIIGFSLIILSFVIIGTVLTIFGITCQPWEVQDWWTTTGCFE